MIIRTSQTHPIRVDFLNSPDFPVLNRLGITFAPGKKQSDAASGFWQRDLTTDLEALKNDFGVDVLVSLVEDAELLRLGIGDLAEGCRLRGIELVRFPIPDLSTPTSEQMWPFVGLVQRIVNDLTTGKTVVIHCKGGLGRAGTVAACCVVAATELRLNPEDAIRLVREARGGGAVENERQETFVSRFGAHWRRRDEDGGDGIEFVAPNEDETKPTDFGHDGGTHYLLFWQERSVLDHASNGLPLDVVASNQLAAVVPGDTIWLVTLNTDRELFLVGRLKVGEIVDYDEAFRRMPDAGLWQAEYYAVPAEGTAEFLQPIRLDGILGDLRFADPDADRFFPADGQLNPQQLQGIRTLTEESAGQLTDLWESREIEIDPEENLVRRKQIVEENPDDHEAHYNLGVAYSELDMTDEAIEAYKKALEINPTYVPALFNLGIAYFRSGELGEAEEQFFKVIDADPEFAEGYFMLGAVLGAGGDASDSIRVTKKGLEYSPEDPLAHFNIANSYNLLENYSEALIWFERAKELGFDPSTVAYLMGKCYRRLGGPADERRSYLEALETRPDLMDAQFALGTLWARQCGGEEGSVIPYIETEGEIDLRDPINIFMFILACIGQNMLDEAREFIDKLRSENPTLAEQAASFIEIAEREEWPDEIGSDSHDSRAERRNKQQQERRTKKEIRMNAGDAEIVAKNIPDLYLQTLKFLVERGSLENVDLPISSGRKRNLVAREPLHKDGTEFFSPVEFGGYYMEAHSSRENGIRLLRELLSDLGIESSVHIEDDGDGGAAREIEATTAHERVLGSMFGLAVCDALGTTAEFKPTGTFPEITAMVGGGPFGLNPGEWTDDTSMALCLAESLIECSGFNADDQMQRYLRWKNEGHLSSNGAAFDIGITIRAALDKYERQGGEKNPFCGSISPSSAGNGSLMRLAPAPLYFAGDPQEAIRMSAESSRTTHGARECIDACRYFAGLIIGAVQGKSKDELLSPMFSPVPDVWRSEPLADRIAEIANGAFKSKKPPQISSTGQGYVVLSLHAALWAFYHSKSFSEGALKVVNLGYDSDTYGAIYGQLAGAYYGLRAIPEEWLQPLAKRKLIEQIAARLVRG